MAAPPEVLTLDDILDLRAYERVRESYRAEVMVRKRRRRLALGPLMTLVFESVDTVRFQIQEMARVEKIISDAGIQAELDVYNRLLPSPGELSATLFIELTTDALLREWLPRLVGIESMVGFELGADGADGFVASEPEADHAQALTRETVTSAVHYLRFPFTEAEVGAFARGPVALVSRHPEYPARTEVAPESRDELLGDLEGRTEPIQPS